MQLHKYITYFNNGYLRATYDYKYVRMLLLFFSQKRKNEYVIRELLNKSCDLSGSVISQVRVFQNKLKQQQRLCKVGAYIVNGKKRI